MDIERIKEQAKEFLGKAQSFLYTDGFVTPILFSFNGNSVTPTGLSMVSEEDKNSARNLMNSLTKTADCMVFVSDSYMLAGEKIFMEGLPKNLKNHKDSIGAIVAFLYTKELTLMREIPYKKENRNYCFFDTGWKDVHEKDGKYYLFDTQNKLRRVILPFPNPYKSV